MLKTEALQAAFKYVLILFNTEKLTTQRRRRKTALFGMAS